MVREWLLCPIVGGAGIIAGERRDKPVRCRECKSRTVQTEPVTPTPSHGRSPVRTDVKR
jgi:hypothetical protein